MNTEKDKITLSAQIVAIDIDGVIGVAEEEQFGVVDHRVATYARFQQALQEVKECGADKLVLNIRSTGGDVADALLIYEAVKELGIPVITRSYGYVASAATIIAQAASKGAREISANSLYLIHCCESSIEGNAHQLSATKELLDKSDQRIAEIYATTAGKSVESFRDLMNENGGRGRWLSPEEALDAGLADVIIASSAISNNASAQVASLGLPPLPQPQPSLKERIVDNCTSILSKVGLGSLFADGATKRRTHKIQPQVSAAESVSNAALQLPSSRLMTAKPTSTLPVEDPLPSAQFKKEGNQLAYENDLEEMKEALRASVSK